MVLGRYNTCLILVKHVIDFMATAKTGPGFFDVFAREIQSIDEGSRVQILGTIVSVRLPAPGSNRPATYLVDDGTGVVEVAKFQNGNLRSANLSSQNVPKSLIDKVEGLRESNSFKKLGMAVEVRGTVKCYKDKKKQILAKSLRELERPTQELERILELPKIRESLKDKKKKL